MSHCERFLGPPGGRKGGILLSNWVVSQIELHFLFDPRRKANLFRESLGIARLTTAAER